MNKKYAVLLIAGMLLSTGLLQAAITQVGSYYVPGLPGYESDIVGTTLYDALIGSGLHIVDVSDPTHFIIDDLQLESIRQNDLLIIMNTEPIEPGYLHESLLDIEAVGWEDFVRHGAALKDFPGFEACPYGWWLGFDNIVAIASAIADELVSMGLDTEVRNIINGKQV